MTMFHQRPRLDGPLSPSETLLRIALHFDFDALARASDRVPSWYDATLRPHYMICIWEGVDRSLWTPLTTDVGWSPRLSIGTDERTGHPRWTRPDCYFFSPSRTWTCTREEVLAGTVRDLSTRWQRNLVLPCVVGRFLRWRGEDEMTGSMPDVA